MENPVVRQAYEKHAKAGISNKVAVGLSSIGVGIARRGVVDLQAVGNVPKDPGIFTFYHTTYIDAPLIVSYLFEQGNTVHGLMDVRSFQRTPVLNSLLRQIPFNTRVCHREDYKWSMGEVDYWLNQGESIIITNDGPSRPQDKRKLEEKLVSDLHARIAIHTGKQVFPVSTYVANAEDIYLFEGKTSWRKLLERWRLDYFIGFSEPINPQDFINSKDLAAETKKRQLAMYEVLKQKEKQHLAGTFSLAKNIIARFRKK